VTIAVCVFTDGRVECLERTLASMSLQVSGGISRRIIWDDTGSDDHWYYVKAKHPEWRVLRSPNGRQGFGGAIRSAWEVLRDMNPSHVLHCEDDFVFERPVDLDLMAYVIDANPHLAQMALRRQAWGPVEEAAGGVVESHPDAYVERFRLMPASDPPVVRWLEHRLWFTTNVSLFRRPILDLGWPDGPHSEGVFSERLRTLGFDGTAGDDVKFGYWGARSDGPWVQHIGTTRVGGGY